MKYINEDKLNRIMLNKDNFYVLIDFDRTLTKGNSVSCWRVLYYSDLLGNDFQEKYDKIHDKTFPNENESKELKKRAYSERFEEYMELLKQKGLNDEIIKKAVQKTDLQLRDGAKEFLNKMYEANVPVIIISCSIGNVLIEFLKYNNCYYDNVHVYANYYNNNGNHICNVTPYNKNEIAFSQAIKDKIKDRYNVLLLGDIIDDINMIEQNRLDSAITVGFLDNKVAENLKAYQENFDIVLTDNSSFKELEEILCKNEDSKI